MAHEPTYEGYVSAGGELDASRFHSSLAHALAFVRETVWPNSPSGEEQGRAWERAVYACVDVDAQYGASGGVGDGAQSVSIGSFSMSAGSATSSQGTDSGWLADMRRAALRELAGSGLLWMGLR